MDKIVPFLHVSEDKFGKEQNVSVLPVKTSMEKCVLNALMVKYGIKSRLNVFVRMDINGMVNIVKELIHVQEIVYGMPHTTVVSAKVTTIGVDTHAFLFLHVKEVNFGIQF